MTSLQRLVFADNYSRYVKPQFSDLSTKEDTDCESLSLAFENLVHMPFDIIDKYGNTLLTLDISYNKFSSNLRFLSEFENLTSLNIDRNNIDGYTILPFMPKLHLLWLNYNNIECLCPFIKNLYNSVPNLRYLCLMGNAAVPNHFNEETSQEYFQYRLYVVSWFPHLIHLDDSVVTQEKRLLAKKKWPLFKHFIENAPFSRFILFLRDKMSNFLTMPTRLIPINSEASREVNVII